MLQVYGEFEAFVLFALLMVYAVTSEVQSIVVCGVIEDDG
jgi:hypothetical protein